MPAPTHQSDPADRLGAAGDGVRIREATATDIDIDLVCRMRLAFVADHRGEPVGALTAEFAVHTRAFIAHCTAAGTLRSWLAEESDACVGVVSMLVMHRPPRPEEPRTAEGYLINMYVAPASRRRGIAAALLATVRTAAGAQGIRRLLLHATDEGRPLYEQAGFAPHPAWMELALP